MPHNPLRIVVAWRPGRNGAEAMSAAAWLARTCEVRIRVVTVLSRGWPLTSLARLSDNDSWVTREARNSERSARTALKAAGIRKGMLDDDQPFVGIESSSEANALTRAAEDFDADVILLGSQFHSPAGRFRAGSTADAMLHYSPISLGLSPRGRRLSKNGVTRINVSYIDTPQSHNALERAADFAMKWDVPLRLLAFTPRGATMYPTEDGFGSSEDLMIEWREQALALIDRGIDRAHTRYPDLRVEADVGSGHGWEDALGALKWKKGDLLVVGSSTLGRFGRVFIGSSTNQIVRHCPVPTLITPA
ncbi:universal stress protein [uncultured Corynebacterium sp.]|uniref:universal stress protein n=1 Tax=uncultured Corynebacterium sp. TaxID=159447 RepID=UPI0025D286E7|nr:universal stress protein [uncultured Corynebacterium sp.]